MMHVVPAGKDGAAPVRVRDISIKQDVTGDMNPCFVLREDSTTHIANVTTYHRCSAQRECRVVRNPDAAAAALIGTVVPY